MNDLDNGVCLLSMERRYRMPIEMHPRIAEQLCAWARMGTVDHQTQRGFVCVALMVTGGTSSVAVFAFDHAPESQTVE
ncbi:MAG: hypothetical protein GXP29_13275 [Planctomycetes bacterium]|nr:hypothetical protein [Planctomycetota bacterium]